MSSSSISGAPSFLRDSIYRERMLACLEAEASGDARAAYARYRSIPGNPDPGHRVELWEMSTLVDSGLELPAYVWSRWITNQAYRWLCFEPDPRLEAIGWATIGGAYPGMGGSISDWADPQAAAIWRLALGSWVARQIGVYEYRGLETFVPEQASRSLLARAEDMSPWMGAEMSGYRLEEAYADRLVVRDLGEDTSYDVLDLGLTDEVTVGEHMIGRLVPVRTTPSLIFESRPVVVDPRTAREVSRCRGGGVMWLSAIWLAVEQGRMPLGFDFRNMSMVSCDLSVQAVRDRLARFARSA